MIGKSVTLVFGFLVLAGTASGTDQSTLFGSAVPEQSGLCAVRQQDGSYLVCVLRSDEEWPSPEVDERWPAYVERVNAFQGMPSGRWIPSAIVEDTRASEIASSKSAFPNDLTDRRQVSWGYFDNGVTSVLAIAYVDETIRSVPENAEMDAEDVTVRRLFAVYYPSSEGDAAGRFADFFLPEAIDHVGGGVGQCEVGLKPGSTLTPRMIARGCREDYLKSVGPSGGRLVEKNSSDDRATIMSDENAAGFACATTLINCGTTCDTTYLSGFTGCESGFSSCLSSSALGCIGMAVLFPIAGAACGGAALVGCGTDNYTCHEVARDVQTICKTTCRTSYQVCCHQDGTSCRTR